ncbi:MAG: PQQ-binding-like beta-propeller repeat protein [Victivallales bacterium]|nr:PQQ-binding-like beta-propeller repeat protein [Victivallales bacterium]
MLRFSCLASLAILAALAVSAQSLDEVTKASGVTGGFVVQLGCGDGQLLEALSANPRFTLHGLDTDPNAVRQTQERLRAAKVYGRASADGWDGKRLPYASDMVSLLVASDAGLRSEINRVLAPNGVALVKTATGWQKTVKPWPGDIDEWSHYMHDPGNNAVAEDTRIAPPRSMQWMGSPKWSRHHDRMASMSALVTAGGKLFYIFDEGSTASVLLPSKWSLIGRDAFNGVVLWKQPIPEWHTRMWPLKSGPAQLPRRLVCTRDEVYATMGFDVPVTAFAAATGQLLRVYDNTKGAEEIIVDKGMLYLVIDPQVDTDKYRNARRVNKPWWTGKEIRVMAVEAASGKTLWEYASPVVPLTLGVKDGGVVFHDGDKIISLDQRTGAKRWVSAPIPVAKRIMSFFAPTLVARSGVVLFAGGEESGLVKSGGGAVKSDTLTGLDAKTGKTLWTADHLPSGYSSPEDLFVIGDTVWFSGGSNGRLPGVTTGLDLRTGKVVKSYPKADVETYWFHHRCHRGKASTRFLMTSRTGIEFIDPATGHWDINHWTRGGCLYGIMPANGLIYTPPHNCACFPESKTSGFSALSAGTALPAPPSGPRAVQGSAFGKVTPSKTPAPWPTLRGNPGRSGSTAETIPENLTEAWQCSLGGKLSAMTIGEGKVFVSQIDAHTIHAIDAASGKPVWQRTVGGRVDSPPTIHGGMAIFGCADGWVYSLRASDGELVWRFRAAPEDIRILVMEQLESRWPVPGSVLVLNNIVHATAGRSMFLDGGIRLVRIDATTGRLISENTQDEKDPETGENLQTLNQRLTLPVALPDVLSTDGERLYMRSQVMDLTGKRLDIAPHNATKLGDHAADQAGEGQHLFASAGFLDGEWFHRAYWVYGRRFEGGWNSYYLAGKHVPAGKMLSFDKDRVYGFGRQPKYFRWTVPMEFQLFASPRGTEALQEAAPRKPQVGSIVRINKSGSLNPANKPVTVSAWVRPLGPSGVILANGGGVIGYTLYLRQGIPHFGVAIGGKRSGVVGKGKLGKAWHHLAGVLAADGTMKLYVNGKLAATGKAGGMLPKEPANALQIAADEESPVASYKGIAFKGDIDDVRIYRGEVTAADLATLASGEARVPAKGAQLVLHYTFDDGEVTDSSGRKNHGELVGGDAVDGRLGDALRFSGVMPGAKSAAKIPYHWTTASPVLVRGMVATPERLFLAGPRDLLDESQAVGKLADEETGERIAAQDAAMLGKDGGLLHIVSTRDGSTARTLEIPTTPVWDGLAASPGRLFLAGLDGAVHCYGPQQ